MGTASVFDLFRGAREDLRVRPRGNIPALDVLRSIAILLVFTSHYGESMGALPAVQALPMFNWGWTGVDLFFVLSGYLIGSQLWKEAQRSGNVRVGRFLLRRGLRIWPLYYAFVAFVALEGLFGRRLDGLWADACFLSNFFHNQIGGGWSLSTEEQFYILAPLSIALLSRFIKPQYLWILPAGGLVDLILNRYLVRNYWPPYQLNPLGTLFMPIFTHADGLAIGGLLAWFAVFRPELIRSTRVRLSACCGMVLLGIGLHTLNRFLLTNTTLALFFGAAVLFGLGLQRTPKLLAWPGFYLISRLSYGMYLNQFGLLERARWLFFVSRVAGGEAAFWAFYVVCLLVSIAIAYATFHLIEWPFLQLRERWLVSGKSQAPMARAAHA